MEDFYKNFNTKKLEEAVDGLNNKITPMLNNLQAEIRKLNRPKAKKNIKCNGNNCSLSLIEDGRILITFSSLDAAENFYKSGDIIKTNKRTFALKRIFGFK